MAKKARTLSAEQRKDARDGYKHGVSIQTLAQLYKVSVDVIKTAVSGVQLNKS